MYIDVSIFIDDVMSDVEQGAKIDATLNKMLPLLKEHAKIAKTRYDKRHDAAPMVELGCSLLSGSYGYMPAKIFRNWMRSNYLIEDNESSKAMEDIAA